MTDSQSVIALLLGDAPDPETVGQYEFSLGELRKTSSTIIPFATELITSGSAPGRELTRNVFMNALETIYLTYAREMKDLRNLGLPPSLPDHCPGCFGPELKERLLIAWTGGNTLEETHHPIREKELFERMDHAHKLLLMQFETSKAPDAYYWRGLAALVIALDPDDNPVELFDVGYDFAQWIGDRPDLNAAIIFAQSRSCFDPETLEGWLDARTDVASPFHDGVL